MLSSAFSRAKVFKEELFLATFLDPAIIVTCIILYSVLHGLIVCFFLWDFHSLMRYD